MVWFRKDLRLEDNPAWQAAVERGVPVVPLYIVDTGGQPWAVGAASRWWLHHALNDLSDQLRDAGSRLIVRAGDSERELEDVLQACGATAVFWNRRYDAHGMQTDGRIKTTLRQRGLTVRSFNASLLREPWEVATQAGRAYQVFTPYSRQCATMVDAEPQVSRGQPRLPSAWPASLQIGELRLLPTTPWDAGLQASWTVSRRAAWQRFDAFSERALAGYADGRDEPAQDGTSRLSPYLHWGMIGPREVAARLRSLPDGKGRQVFYRELIWREFAYHVLYHFPHTSDQPLQARFSAFPWLEDAASLRAWQRGLTGYPLVDAGMRQLWQTGWMHNRVRMVVASFLVKHLLQSWLLGARWFWDTLVDADLASNTLGWQWAGGCGADAAPYFRIFNPITQSQKFDPAGHYIRRYVPELAQLPKDLLHEPWRMSASQQARYGCRLGEDYPLPIVEHRFARERALSALERLGQTQPADRR